MLPNPALFQEKQKSEEPLCYFLNITEVCARPVKNYKVFLALSIHYTIPLRIFLVQDKVLAESSIQTALTIQ